MLAKKKNILFFYLNITIDTMGGVCGGDGSLYNFKTLLYFFYKKEYYFLYLYFYIYTT